MNKLQPSIKISKARKLVGNRMRMSLTNNKTIELWKNFILRRTELSNHLSTEYISMQIYEPSYHANFDPDNEFEKWATIEVSDFNDIPDNMEMFNLKGGLYAVFNYKGSSADNRIFQYIFSTWLPNSEYQLDNRPHFEVLGEKYKNNDPNSEEEIWIPIKINKQHGSKIKC